MAKCVLKVAMQEENEDCGTDQLCEEMESGIELGIHTMFLLWQKYAHDQYWVFILIDARNAFKE